LRHYLTLLGAWTIAFPINLALTLSIFSIHMITKVFNLPVDLWKQLDKELRNIHIEED
jgi:hypothetical protein